MSGNLLIQAKDLAKIDALMSGDELEDFLGDRVMAKDFTQAPPPIPMANQAPQQHSKRN